MVTARIDDDDPEAALREARDRFIGGFSQRVAAMQLLVDAVAEHGDTGPLASLRQVAHRMAGLAGMVGLPSVSTAASALEDLAGSLASFDAGTARAELERMKEGFSGDLLRPPPSWASPAARTPAVPARILVVEDDDDQRRIVEQGLRAAGYRVSMSATGSDAVARARTERPDLILLDIDLPGLDGHAVCRQLKSDPALSQTPVVFLTARSAVVDRMAGLTLGADDYISKPFDPGEMLLRVRRLVTRARPSAAPDAAPAAPPVRTVRGAMLDFSTFTLTAREALGRAGAALALVRAEADHLLTMAEALVEELRRRDLVGRYSETHLVLLLPEFSAAAARQKIEAVIARLKARSIEGVSAGVAARPAVAADQSAAVLDAMLSEADLALAAARLAGADTGAHGETASERRRRTTVLIAEDDPDVLHIVDPRLKAAGYKTVLAFDGQQALDAIAQSAPSVVLLDLMMPKLTGFDVLARMRDLPPPRPRSIVVSARGREEDVTRAFELGADDYLTKPFSPQELVARIARLLR